MPAESTLATFTASDGENLAVQDWPLEDATPLRGVVVIVHGLGEHAARHERLAKRLNGWGFAVRGYDQYGHGESGGVRGSLSSDTRLLDDLFDILESTRARMRRGTPLILLGHSMGGLIAARFVALGLRPIDALVLSSPALGVKIGWWTKWALHALRRVAPDLRWRNGLDPQYLSHDPAVVRAYLGDRLCHDRISVRLAGWIASQGPATVACAARWTVPTLLMYAGADRLVDPAGSRAFARLAPPALVSGHGFEAMHHEIFNEPDAEPVFAVLEHWLAQRFP